MKFAAGISVVLIATVAFLHDKGMLFSGPRPTPNVLVLSFCSLRKEHLRIYNPQARPLPNLDRLLAKSLVLRNAVNGLPWTNITNYVEFDWLHQIGFLNRRKQKLRVPPVPINQNAMENAEFSVSRREVRNYELQYDDGVEKLARTLTNGELKKPFYVSSHFKYLHLPYIDSINQKDEWKSKFTPRSKQLLEQYLADPRRYPEKGALLLTLFSDPDLVRGNPFAEKYISDFNNVHMGQIYQILSDKALLDSWRTSQFYREDLQMLDEAYYLKLLNLDHVLEPVLKLFEDGGELAENTILVFTGDHGESLMENDVFLHSNNIGD